MAAIATAALGHVACAQSANDRPWDDPNVLIVIDPYSENDIDWDKAVTDKRLKAVVHKASEGSSVDSKFVSRATEAKKRGLLWGAYHLGWPGDPIAQAELLLEQARKTEAKLLAIDIEADDPNKFMSLTDAARFIDHVHAKTLRYPLVYVNFSTYEAISAQFDASSVFARAPLWIARFQAHVGLNNTRIWQDYTFWQFSSEINCSPTVKCFYRVPGTSTDMDVNVFRGDETALRALFE